ncbi:MAG: diguanylate cyclase domain-containing protein [Stenotrophomonas sp.]|uniref:GGDEF domain-containing protein n=1 Tax=Stenotrophomonas sp. TaxID=69392 RepID=UPI003D6C8856
MSATAEQYFALVVPATSLLLGLSLVAGWNSLREQRYLLWMAAGYILVGLPLAAQSLMTNAQMAQWAVVTGASYCLGSLGSAQGFAARSGGRVSTAAAIFIIALTLGGLFYFSRITDQLGARVIVINAGMALLLALPVPHLLRNGRPARAFERLLLYSYLVLVAYSLLRPLTAFTFAFQANSAVLSRSGLWLWMLAINLMLNLWFVFLLLGSVIYGLMSRLRHERNHDPLTALLNRRAFFEIANKRLKNERRARWALVGCDVDHFKRINDTWGHAAGDHVLREVGALLTRMVRQNDVVARFGGEEFVLLLRCQDLGTAFDITERIRATLSRTPYSPIKEALTASFGVTMVEGAEDLSDALQRADIAVYEAKRGGRNQVIRAGPQPSHARP